MSTMRTNSIKQIALRPCSGQANSKEFLTNSANQTKNLGKKIAKELLNSPLTGKALVLCLKGDLGAGKTTFIQGLAEGLGVKENITSPTFVLMKKFSIFNFQFSNKRYFYHFDCYRIQNPEEILELGWQEIISNPQNIVAIEWPERIKKFLPKKTILLSFKWQDKNKREVRV